MRHLGDRVSALVDGELDPVARESALAHLVGCQRCRAALDAERRVKARLRALPANEPSADLLGSLFAAPAGIPWQRRPAPAPAAASRRPGLVLAGAGSLSLALFGAAYLAGGGTSPAAPIAPPVTPAVGRFSAEFAGTTEGLPFSDPAVGVVPAAVTTTFSPGAGR